MKSLLQLYARYSVLVSYLQLGGILLISGLGARLPGLLLTGNMLVAYRTADGDALFSVFSDPGKFTSLIRTRFCSPPPWSLYSARGCS
jgi:hypothetical protein